MSSTGKVGSGKLPARLGLDAKKMIFVLLREKNPAGAESHENMGIIGGINTILKHLLYYF